MIVHCSSSRVLFGARHSVFDGGEPGGDGAHSHRRGVLLRGPASGVRGARHCHRDARRRFAGSKQVRRAVHVARLRSFLPLVRVGGIVRAEIKGAQRWFDFGFFSLQPSEILKPALIVVWAWMLGESMKQPGFPGRQSRSVFMALAAGAAGATGCRPNRAARFLPGADAWFFRRCAALVAWRRRACCSARGRSTISIRTRATAWMPGSIPKGDGAYQVNRALDAIAAGGVFGRGPGEGVIKRILAGCARGLCVRRRR
jgi:cell division protein FtsW (lipid II flippase)